MLFYRSLKARLIGDDSAFTLVELLVVILIIAILAAAAVMTFLSQQAKAQDTEARERLSTAYKASRAELTIPDNKFPAITPLVNGLAAGEPGISFVAGTGYLADTVSVERVSDTELWLRTLSDSGRKCHWHYDVNLSITNVRECETEPGSGGGGQLLAAGLTNGVLNPSFEHPTLFSYSVARAVPTQTAFEASNAWSTSGTKSLHFAGKANASPGYQYTRLAYLGGYHPQVVGGQTYTLSFDLKVVDGIPSGPSSPKVLYQWFENNFTAVGSQQVGATVDASTPGVQRVVVSGLTAPPTANYVHIDLLSNSSPSPNPLPANESFDYYIDSVLLNETANTYYFDGSNNGVWNGAANNSTSTSLAVNGGSGGWSSY